jgi:restriction system protein
MIKADDVLPPYIPDHPLAVDSSHVRRAVSVAYEKIRGELKADLLDRLRAEAPTVFERIVIALLVKMGYGGSRASYRQIW